MATIETMNLKLLAVLIASGVEINLYRKPARPQTVLGSFPDTSRNRDLVTAYERRQVLQVPHKAVMQAYVELGYECKRLVMEGL